ncbi:MAG: tyrosine recombinase XerC [Candidatus Saccharibacteria bacterium]|nr:tyrosine recombinase XerC [Candidatus Saccharibacteria bacterium]
MNEVTVRQAQVIEILIKTHNWMLTHMDVSAETITDYSGRLKPFIEYILANSINESTLLSYKRVLAADKTLKISTKNKKLTVARLLLKEMDRRKALPDGMILDVKGFQQNKKHKLNGLDDDEIALLREWVSLNQYRSPKHIRLTCLLLLLTYHGLRQIEVCRMEYEDIDFAGNTVLIQGKGRDDKESVHLNPTVTAAMRRYCDEYQIKSGKVFFSISNNASHGDPLTTRGLRMTVTKLFNQLGIDKNVHGLRHWYVTRLVKEFPGDLFMIMSFTRHRSLEQLQTYNDTVMQAKNFPKHDHIFEKVLV